MIITSILIISSILLLINIDSQSYDIPNWIKNNAERVAIQDNIRQEDIILTLENLSYAGVIKNMMYSDSQIYDIPPRGKITFVTLSGNVNEYGKTGFVLLEIHKPDDTKEILSTPVLETGFYSTVFPISDKSQKGTYRILAEFNGKQTSMSHFSLTDTIISEKIPSWFVIVFHWWIENKITDIEFIQCVQHLVDEKILIVIIDNQNISELKVSVDGQHLVRRGITHIITSHITYGEQSVEGARVTLTIEDYGKNIIREFSGFTDNNGEFIFSWEIPKKFNDIETLFAHISVTYDNSSVTKLFKFQVYCMPGESNCKINGNR